MNAGPHRIRRLGVFGGTFDPPHVGHVAAAEEALRAFRLDLVLFVPTGQPWQKHRFSDPEDRYLMTVLCAASHPGFATSRMEIDRPGPTYTADTLEELRGFYGNGVALFFIAGADAVMNLGTWRGLERLEELAEVIAVVRPGFDLGSVAPAPNWPRINVLEMRGVDVSSTDIRARAARGEPVQELVPGEIARFIERSELYSEKREARRA